MLLRFTHLCLSALLVAAAALAGCNEDQARFADATPAQLDRAYSAASGLDLTSGLFIAAAFSGLNNTTSCPAVATKGQDTSVSGGCTADDGTRLEGSIAIHNLPGLVGNPAYAPSQKSSIELDFRVTPPGLGEIALVGHIELDGSSESDDLTLHAQDLSSTSRLTLTCGLDGTCTASPGSEIELSDLGTANVEGRWSLGDPPSGGVTVRGADVLRFDIANRDDNSCVPYTVGDKHGTACAPDGGAAAPQVLATLKAQTGAAPMLSTKRFPWM